MLLCAPVQADNNAQRHMKESSDVDRSTTPSLSSKVVECPTNFQGVKLVEKAKQCQWFNQRLPSALVYYTDYSPSHVLSFYEKNLANAVVHSPVNQRILVTAHQGAVKVVISPDKSGSQVDILVLDEQ
ncbi:hypothetical protein D210916BOD24_24750 [Alteromonas sp. D210916BOD_24]